MCVSKLNNNRADTDAVMSCLLILFYLRYWLGNSGICLLYMKCTISRIKGSDEHLIWFWKKLNWSWYAQAQDACSVTLQSSSKLWCGEPTVWQIKFKNNVFSSELWSKIYISVFETTMSLCWQAQGNCNPSFGSSIRCRMATLHDSKRGKGRGVGKYLDVQRSYAVRFYSKFN